MKTKQCARCKETKFCSMFYKDKRTKDNLFPWCKECKNNSDKKYTDRRLRTVSGYLRHLFHCIRQRCNNPKYPKYKYWGGRGIKCKFKNANEFINYVISKLQIDPHGLTIDRINNDKHYEPGNIRFVTIAENNRNKRKKSK